MKEWPELPRDRELERADDLLDQADALLRRHHARNEARTDAADAWAPAAGLDDDDLPILTEVVDDFAFPSGTAPGPRAPGDAYAYGPSYAGGPFEGFDAATPHAPSAPARTAPPASEAISSRLAERLIELDTEIAREIGNWVAAEMPQILARELDQLASRVQAELQAHLRATLLPELSARVGKLLDQTADPAATPDRPPLP